MRRSTNGIICSHAGTLPRPADLQQLMAAGPAKAAEFQQRLPSAVAEIVDRQIKAGVDVVNDGELGKLGGFSGYIRDRMTGVKPGQLKPGQEPHNVNKRDALEFPGAYEVYRENTRRRQEARLGSTPRVATGQGWDTYFCVEPLKYVGAETVASDIRILKDAVKGKDVEPYLPAVAPGTIEHWLWNDYYK